MSRRVPDSEGAIIGVGEAAEVCAFRVKVFRELHPQQNGQR